MSPALTGICAYSNHWMRAGGFRARDTWRTTRVRDRCITGSLVHRDIMPTKRQW